MKPLRIAEPLIERRGDEQIRISTTIGDQTLWFETAEAIATPLRGEPFVIAALLPAMIQGSPLIAPASLPICPVLLQNLHQLQQIFRQWLPVFGHPATVVPIEVATEAAPPGRGAGSFFSGGVDGSYTWLEAPEPLPLAVFARGIDFQLDNPIYDESFARNAAWLAERGTRLLALSSNIRWFGRSFGLGWNSYFGAGLAALAHVADLSRTYIASGHTWAELWPDGSHPASDPLWSSSTHRIIHHARGVMRWQKLDRIAREPGALDLLRVCWQDQGFNCGRCEKCLRTMVLLRLLGLSSPNFPPLTHLASIARLVPENRSDAVFVSEALDLAVSRGDHEAARALAASLRRWRLRQFLRHADEGWLGGRLRSLLRAGRA